MPTHNPPTPADGILISFTYGIGTTIVISND
jgi:hypothetical protein